MLNGVVTLQQRFGNVFITSERDVVTTSETDADTTLILDRVTALLQRQQRCCDNVATTSLCQLGSDEKQLQTSCLWQFFNFSINVILYVREIHGE